MTNSNLHDERHLIERVGWLRAAVLGANDGIVSTASLIIGVAAAAADRGEVVLAGAAGLVAGAMSMAAGEYVSVSSQSDTEAADLARELRELSVSPECEEAELSSIYSMRGLDKATADEVAAQLMAKDAIGSHARDELSITQTTKARPVQAAFTSAATFTAGGSLPMLTALVMPTGIVTIAAVCIGSVVSLALLGAVGARAGGAPVGKAAVRVVLWGALAMAVTAGIGKLVGTAI
jgi:VIT1/CCC1 family predicted Fe2+/Mn2+ transporter